VRQQSAPASAPLPHSARVRRGVLAIGLLVTVAACGNGHQEPSATTAPSTTAATTGTSASEPATHTTPSATRTTSSAPAVPSSVKPTTTKPATSCVDRTVNAMSTAQRVGQLFMTGVSSTGMTTSEADVITRGKVGSAFLMGRTTGGTAAVKSLTARVRSRGPSVSGSKLGMFIATDQEGGQVQVLGGPGFSTIPSAVTQGQWSTSTLQSSARTWGRQLRSAGVNMNLAPVADTVPPDLTGVNAPIGKFDREYGTDPATVASHSTAFMRGMKQVGVDPAIKHFPGLGRVTGNTDVTAHVVDSVTTRTDPFLQPFRSGIQAGTPFVMVSSAIYSRIDPNNQAAFSSAVIRGMLRGSLGFQGAVISDDLGKAVAVADRTPAQRAVDYFTAGGNLLLTVKPADIAPMTSAVITALPKNAALRSAVNDSLHRVLTAKRNAGLLTCG
jgi:beta-N-acetylhexosaminidase